MSDLKKYIKKRKDEDKEFATNYEEGYQDFKLSVMIKDARKQKGLTQKQLAERLCVSPPVISRLENNAADVKVSTLNRIAKGMNMRLNIELIPV